MKRRRWLILLLAIPLILVLGLLAAVALIPTDRVAEVAAEKASAALGREVRLDGVELSFLPPGVSLTGIAIAGRTQSDTPVATVERVVLRPRLLPLLRRQVVVDAIILDSPQVLVEVDAESISNLPVLAGGKEAPGEATSPAKDSGGALAFLVRRIQINNAHLTYHDARTETRVSVAGLDQRLRLAGDLAGGALRRISLEGEIEIPNLSVSAPQRLAVPLDSIQIGVAHRASLDLEGDSLSLDHLAVTIQGLALEGTGTIHSLSDSTARTIALELGAGPADLGEILTSLPRELLALSGPDGKPATLPDLDGTLQIEVAVNGRLGGDTIPEVAGSASLDDFSLRYGGLGEVVSALSGRIAFSLDSLVTEGIGGRILDEAFHLDFAIHDLAAPHLRGGVKTTLDLGRAASRGLLPDSVEAAGRVGVDLRADIEVGSPEAGRIDGGIGLEGIRIAAPALLEPVTIGAGRIAFSGDRLQIADLGVGLGESDITIDLDLRRWLPLVFGDTTALPRVDLATRSQLLDLDAILGPADTLTYGDLLFARMAEREIGGRPVEEIAEEAGLGLPAIPPLELKGSIRAGEVRREKLVLRDVVVGLSANGDRIELTDARFEMMGGGIQVAAQVGMPLARGDAEEAPSYPVAFTFQLQDVGAGPFFDTFTPFRDHLTGSLLLAGSGQAVLDQHLLPIRESIRAKGSGAVSDGQLINWPALQKLGQELSAVGFDTLYFKDLASSFSISGPRIMLHQTAVAAGEIGIDAAGSLDFNGELDLGATIHLPQEIVSRIRSDLANRLIAAASAGDGRVPIGVKVAGPALSPSLELDFSVAAANIAEQARAEAERRAREVEEKAKEKIEEEARKAIDRILPGGVDSLRARTGTDSVSVPAAADSARARAEQEARKRLCRLIGC